MCHYVVMWWLRKSRQNARVLKFGKLLCINLIDRLSKFWHSIDVLEAKFATKRLNECAYKSIVVKSSVNFIVLERTSNSKIIITKKYQCLFYQAIIIIFRHFTFDKYVCKQLQTSNARVTYFWKMKVLTSLPY